MPITPAKRLPVRQLAGVVCAQSRVELRGLMASTADTTANLAWSASAKPACGKRCAEKQRVKVAAPASAS